MKQEGIDTGRAESVSPDERAERVPLRRDLRVAQMKIEVIKRASARVRLVRELAEDADLPVDVTVACRRLKMSRSDYYERLGRTPQRPAGSPTNG
jgi:hypothetical protein